MASGQGRWPRYPGHPKYPKASAQPTPLGILQTEIKQAGIRAETVGFKKFPLQLEAEWSPKLREYPQPPITQDVSRSHEQSDASRAGGKARACYCT